MIVLLCHNYYQLRGGEDQSFEDEGRLLEANGHRVVRFTVHSDAIKAMSHFDVAWRTVWNEQAYRSLREIVRRERPEIMHCTNTFPLLSPACYYAARAEGVPVVQSLRNYRLLCPAFDLLRAGRVCEECLGRTIPWPGVMRRCYRESRTATAVLAAMVVVHRALRTWTRAVTLYFTPTEFARRKYLEAGWPPDRIAVKPNFVDPDPKRGTGGGRYAVFVGRLSLEKGVDTLLAAWERLRDQVPLVVIGDGPLAPHVEDASRRNPAVRWLGQRPLHETLSIVGEAMCLIMPSIWYETFGRTIMEAFAKGVPVVASRMGAMAELVEDGRTGLHFTPGSPDELAAKVRQLAGDPRMCETMRGEVRKEYETKYTAAANYTMLMDLYHRALCQAQKKDVNRHDKTTENCGRG